MQNKNTILLIIIVILLSVGVWFVAKKGNDPRLENDRLAKNQQDDRSQDLQEDSCLVVTSPVVNQAVSFPLVIKGYIDVAGAKANTCVSWGAFEGTAGSIVVKDMKGAIKSLDVRINTVGDYYAGMKQWPITATIQGLTGVPSSNQIALYMASDEQRDGYSPTIKVLQPLMISKDSVGLAMYTYKAHGFTMELPSGFVPTEQPSEGGPSSVLTLPNSSFLTYVTNAAWWEQNVVKSVFKTGEKRIGNTTFQVYSFPDGATTYWHKQGNVGYEFIGDIELLKTFKFVGWN